MFTLNLTTEQQQLVLAALGKQAYEVVYTLIKGLQEQVAAGGESIQLNLESTNLVLAALAKQPFDVVSSTIDAIKGQAEQQIAEQQTAQTAE